MTSMVRLGDILEIKNGFAFKSDLFCDKTRGIPLIRIRDLGKPETECNYDGPYRDEFVVRDGDMLIGMDGDFECYQWSGGDALLNQRVCRLQDFSSHVIPAYVYYAIQRELAEIHATTAFVTVKHISARQIADINIPLPPLAEQQRIVDILDRAASIQRLRKAADDKLKEIIPALFVDMFGDLSGDTQRWPVTTLSAVTTIGSGVTKGRKFDDEDVVDVPYLRVANVQDGYLDLSEIKYITIRSSERSKYELRAGDIVMTEGGDLDKLGRGYVWEAELPYCAHQNHVFRVRPNIKVVKPYYLATLASSPYGKNYFLRVAKRTTGIASINKTQLGGMPVPFPPIDLQDRFEARLQELRSMARLTDKATSLALTVSSAISLDMFS